MTMGNMAELVATVSVALLIVLLSARTIGYRGEQCNSGESVSQPPLKDKAFSTFPDQNPPLELRPENGISPPTRACSANGQSSTARLSSHQRKANCRRVVQLYRLASEGKDHTFKSYRARHDLNDLIKASAVSEIETHLKRT